MKNKKINQESARIIANSFGTKQSKSQFRVFLKENGLASDDEEADKLIKELISQSHHFTPKKWSQKQMRFKINERKENGTTVYLLEKWSVIAKNSLNKTITDKNKNRHEEKTR